MTRICQRFGLRNGGCFSVLFWGHGGKLVLKDWVRLVGNSEIILVLKESLIDRSTASQHRSQKTLLRISSKCQVRYRESLLFLALLIARVVNCIDSDSTRQERIVVNTIFFVVKLL